MFSIEQFPNLLYRRLQSRQGVETLGTSGLGNPRYSRLGSLRYNKVFCRALFQGCIHGVITPGQLVPRNLWAE
jgi:hypothetical protein